MHPNPSYRGATNEANLGFAAARSFGTLAISAPEGPLLSHVPFLIAPDRTSLDLHLVRSNPIVRAVAAGPVPVAIAVLGPDAYVSPDWYGITDQVPTWNYIAVHLRGRIAPLDPATMRDMLDRQSADLEARLAPKAPWTTAKMDPQALDRLMRMILPFRMTIDDVQGTWKLSQNKPDEARFGAADGVAASPTGLALAEIARLMKDAQN